MFSVFENGLGTSSHRAARLELFLEDGCSYVEVQSGGDIEDMRLLPLDRLILHKLNEIDDNHSYDSGELLVLQPRGWGTIALGRKYGNYILMEPFGKPVSLERWGIVGAVLAIERTLGMGCGLGTAAHVGLYNAPKELDEFIKEEYMCDSIYIAEISSRLSEEAPESSCVVAHEVSFLNALLAQVPTGKLWISPTTKESVPDFCQPWQIMSKRAQRKNWIRRHQSQPMYHTSLPNPAKEPHQKCIHEVMASK